MRKGREDRELSVEISLTTSLTHLLSFSLSSNFCLLYYLKCIDPFIVVQQRVQGYTRVWLFNCSVYSRLRQRLCRHSL